MAMDHLLVYPALYFGGGRLAERARLGGRASFGAGLPRNSTSGLLTLESGNPSPCPGNIRRSAAEPS